MAKAKFELIKWFVILLVPVLTHTAVLPSYGLEKAGTTLRFERISLEQGLSQASILCMLQDSQGFLWLGTYDGLNRYDGYNFTIYKSDVKNKNSLSDNGIRALYEDRSGRIWIGTSGGGLNMYDRKTDHFHHYKHDPADATSISGNEIRSIFEDSRGVLWVGTNNGLNAFDRTTGKSIRYQRDPENPDSIAGNQIQVIYEDPNKNLWIGVERGISRFDRETQSFVNIGVAPGDPLHPKKIGGYYVRSIWYESPDTLWIGTEKPGLNRLELSTGKISHYLVSHNVHCIYNDSRGNFWVATNKGLAQRVVARRDNTENPHYRFVIHSHNPFDPESLSHDEVFSIIEDSSGIIWVGTNGAGLSKLNPAVQSVTLWRRTPGSSSSLSGNHVAAVCESEEGILWVGTYKNGLNRIDRHTGEVIYIPLSRFVPSSPPGNPVRRLLIGHDGYLWIATGETGLIKMDRMTYDCTIYRHDKNDLQSLSMDNVYFVFEDSDKTIWAGTSKKGLNRLDKETGKFKRYQVDRNNPHSISHNRVRYMMEGSDGYLWIGTNKGLNRFDRNKEIFDHWEHDPADPNSISHNRTTPILEDGEGGFWVGTDMGLNRFDPETGIFKHYTTDDGLENDAIQALEMDQKGRLWMSTFKGISVLDPGTGDIRNYNVRDGLQGIEFWMNAGFKNNEGEMFFGGLNGLNSFFPDDIKLNKHEPPVVITHFKVMNRPRSLPIANRGVGEIILSYKDLFFSFTFAGLDYAAPEENVYKYMLEGFDRDWVDIGNARTAVYTNIDPGRYTFRVKAANNDGVWNSLGASAKITITPPFWRTAWFKALVVLSVAAILLGFYTYRVRSLKAQRERLEIQVQERTVALREEIEERKQIEIALQEARDFLEERVIERTERLRRLTSELSLTEERERRAIATNLHDNICQNLALSEIKLKQMKEDGSSLELDSLLTEVKELINQMSVDVRSLMVELSPPILYDIGLVAALDWLVEQFQEKYQIKAAFIDNGDKIFLDDDLKILLFRSVRELMFNIIKHAKADTATITFSSNNSNVQIDVKDDGVGFDMNKYDERSDNVYSFGLFSVRERLLAIGGQLTLESEIGKGVKATITAPIKKAGTDY